MGSMVLDAVRVNNFILPNLTKAKNSLTDAAKYGNSVERYAGDSPISSRSNLNAAKVRSLASNLTKRLGTISSNINTVSVKLDAKLEKAKLIEKKNKAKSTAISAAVGAVAGAAGAALGAATGGIKGAVVGGAVGAAVGVAASKTVKNVVSSVGKALKNTGAKIAKNVGNFFKSIGNGLKKIGKSIVNACKKIANKVVSFVKEKIGPIVKAIGKGVLAVGKFFVKTAATVVNLCVSLVEGVVSLVEALGDVVLMAVGAVCSVVTAVADVVRGVCTGEWDWKCTGAVWKKWIMPWVGYDWTDKVFDGVEKINVFDKLSWEWGKRKGGDGAACKIAKGVGYVAGIVVASVFTAGAAGAVAGAGSGVAGGAAAVASLGTAAGASVASSAAVTVASTAISGAAKFAQETQKGYNKLSDEEKQSGAMIGKVLGASAIKGGIEAATWYVTYGNGGAKLVGSKSKAVDGLGKLLTSKTKFVQPKSFLGKAFASNIGTASLTKAGIQGLKAYANEGASVIVDGEYDLKSANTNAIVSAGTSFVYDNTFGSWLKSGTKSERAKVSAAKQTAEASQSSQTTASALGYTTDAATKSSGKSTLIGILDSIKEKGTKMLDAADPFLKYASGDAGGKKIIGGGIKNIYKDIGNNIIDSLTPEGAS